MSTEFSPYVEFSRDEWARLRLATPLTVTADDLETLRGINEQLSLDEVSEVYLPLSRLLNLHVGAAQGLHQLTDLFLGKPAGRAPYVIAVAGSVAVGKSTTARILQTLLSRWPNHPVVALVTTDSFLYPNQVLDARGLSARKGFPETYDIRALTKFLGDLKSGAGQLTTPVYSHLVYDVLPGQANVITQPDIVIIEGLNVLQLPDAASARRLHTFVSDFFDFSIYVDAEETDIESWFVARFLTLRQTAFRDPTSFFRRFAEISEEEAIAFAHEVWTGINGRNLAENILPTRDRARLVLEKGSDHAVRLVKMRKL